MTTTAIPRVAILGAGPIGIEAALAAAEAGFTFTLYEASPAVGGYVRACGHVRLFSPWDLNVSPRMRRWLNREGREAPTGDECPTGHELAARVLAPLAELPTISSRLRVDTRVLAVGRERLLKHEAIGSSDRARQPFRLLLRDASGREVVERASVVLDCTGTYGQPNALGDGGIPAPGERALEGWIVRKNPDVLGRPEAWAESRILLVGAGHSAQTAARELAELGRTYPATRVLWALRKPEPQWAVVADDPLPERARLAATAHALAAGASPNIEVRTDVTIDALSRERGRIDVRLRASDGEATTVSVDRVLSLTGYVGDHTLYRQLQVHECYATSGPMKLAAALLSDGSADCLTPQDHGADTLVNPEPGFFILGSKSYGRNNTFLMRTGWQQVDSVFQSLRHGCRDPE